MSLYLRLLRLRGAESKSAASGPRTPSVAAPPPEPVTPERIHALAQTLGRVARDVESRRGTLQTLNRHLTSLQNRLDFFERLSGQLRQTLEPDASTEPGPRDAPHPAADASIRDAPPPADPVPVQAAHAVYASPPPLGEGPVAPKGPWTWRHHYAALAWMGHVVRVVPSDALPGLLAYYRDVGWVGDAHHARLAALSKGLPPDPKRHAPHQPTAARLARLHQASLRLFTALQRDVLPKDPRALDRFVDGLFRDA